MIMHRRLENVLITITWREFIKYFCFKMCTAGIVRDYCFPLHPPIVSESVWRRAIHGHSHDQIRWLAALLPFNWRTAVK